jgi:hypothetical protein
MHSEAYEYSPFPFAFSLHCIVGSFGWLLLAGMLLFTRLACPCHHCVRYGSWMEGRRINDGWKRRMDGVWNVC